LGGSRSGLISFRGAPGSPPERSGTQQSYDTANDRLIVFGGCHAGCLPTLNDVWILTNARALRNANCSALPLAGSNPRVRHTAVYDPGSNSMIIFAGQTGGGFGCSTFSDVWMLNNANVLGNPYLDAAEPHRRSTSRQYAPTAVTIGKQSDDSFGGGGFFNGICQDNNAVWSCAMLTVRRHPCMDKPDSRGRQAHLPPVFSLCGL